MLHHPYRHPHHREEFLGTLAILIKEGYVKTAEEMIRYAERHHEAEAAEFLRTAEVADVGLLFHALEVHLEIEAHKEHNNRLSDWQNRRVALIFPLPPHIHEPLLGLPDVTILMPRRHHLPPHLRRRLSKAVHESWACRQVVAGANAIVFEGYRDNGIYYVDDGIADILELRIVPVMTQLLIHLRPHPHPEDVEFDPGSHPLSPL